jgi:hypothetical protein
MINKSEMRIEKSGFTSRISCLTSTVEFSISVNYIFPDTTLFPYESLQGRLNLKKQPEEYKKKNTTRRNNKKIRKKKE